MAEIVRRRRCEIRFANREGRRAYAETVTTFLALALDRCADFNNCLCRWSSSNQKVMNLFGRQALPMVFDFCRGKLPWRFGRVRGTRAANTWPIA